MANENESQEVGSTFSKFSSYSIHMDTSYIDCRVSIFEEFQLEHSKYVAMTTSDLKRILFYVFTSLAKILKISDKNEGLQTLNYSKKFKIKLSKVSVQMTNLKFKS